MEYINLVTGDCFEIGVIEKIQGEILDVKINKIEQYKLGYTLVCIYGGIHFKTRILKKNNRVISIYVSLTQKEFPTDQREYPRVPVSLEAHINTNMEENVYFTKPVLPVDVSDISIKGFGFISTRKLAVGPHPYYLYVETGAGQIKAEIILRHEEAIRSEKFQYGCEIVDISKHHLNGLLRLVLKKQLELSTTVD